MSSARRHPISDAEIVDSVHNHLDEEANRLVNGDSYYRRHSIPVTSSVSLCDRVPRFWSS